MPMRLVSKSLVDLLADITMIKLSNNGGSDQSVHKQGNEIFFSFDLSPLIHVYLKDRIDRLEDIFRQFYKLDSLQITPVWLSSRLVPLVDKALLPLRIYMLTSY